MKNKIGNQRLYLNPAKSHKEQMEAVWLLYGYDVVIMAENGFLSTEDGPVFGDCQVVSIKNKYFSYYADGTLWDDGVIASATFYVVSQE